MNSKRRRHLLNTALVAFMLSSATLGAQAPTLRADQDVHGRKGWELETDRVHVGLLQNGGHMAEIRLISDNPRLSINPMFIPTGNGYMGHMVCFPNVGPASPDERQNGIGGHGVARIGDEPHEPRRNNLRNGNPSGDPSKAPRCGAMTRRQTACQCPAMRNRRRCRLHGGKSTGPKTPAGLERSQRARWKHGVYSRETRELLANNRRRWRDLWALLTTA